MMNFKTMTLLAATTLLFAACTEDDNNESSKVELMAHSSTPNLLKLDDAFATLKVYPMLSSEDQLEDSPNFIYGSMADGAGLLKNQDGTFSLINNIEADYAIARITFDETFAPVKGEHILNASATAATAQCSGS